MADYKTTPTGIEGVISEDAYNTYQGNKDLDAIRSGVAQTDQDTIDESINGLSTNGSGFATSTNLGTDWLSNLMQGGVILDQERLAEQKRITEQRKSGITSMLEAGRSRIDSQFRRMIQEATEIGKNEVGYARAMMARAGGGDMGADTATMGAIQSVQQGAERRLDELRSRREEAMSNLDFEMASKMDAILNDEAEELDKFYTDAWKKKLDIIGLASDQEKNNLLKLQMDWDQVSKLKEGTTWISPITGQSYTGALSNDPTTAEILRIAENVPLGTTKEYPINGKMYTIVGLGKPDINTEVKYFEDNETGNVTAIYTDLTKLQSDPTYKPRVVNMGKISTPRDSSGGSDKKFSFTTADRQAMVAADIKLPDINLIEKDLQTNSWSEVKEGLAGYTENQVAVIENVMGQKNLPQAISIENVSSKFSDDQLMEMAIRVGENIFDDKKRFIDTGGSFLKKNTLRKNDFLQWIISKAQSDIEQGKTLKQVWADISSL